jgi:hypothetical protein
MAAGHTMTHDLPVSNVLLLLLLEPIGRLLRASRLATIHDPGAIERIQADSEVKEEPNAVPHRA